MGDRVIPVKIERIALGGGQDNIRYMPANINEDYLAARGMYFQKTTGADSLVGIERGAADNNLTLFDGSAGSLNLTRLSDGRPWWQEVFTGFAYQSIQLGDYECRNYESALVILNGLVLERGQDYDWTAPYECDLYFTMDVADRLVIRYQY